MHTYIHTYLYYHLHPFYVMLFKLKVLVAKQHPTNIYTYLTYMHTCTIHS